MATRFDKINSNTEIGTLTLRTASGDVKFGSENFGDKTVDITTGGSFDPSEIQNAILQLQSGKQDTLIAGTNIKTINGSSILGSGNITIQGGGGSGVTIEDVEQVVDEACGDLEDRIDEIDLKTGNLGTLANYNVQVLTQQEYDNLQERDSHTFYCILDGVVSENDNDDE